MIRIIYKDNDICVISKPSGVITNNAETSGENTVQNWLTSEFKLDLVGKAGEFYEKGGIVHRLDKDTSGVMVLALNESAYEGLKKQFMERTAKKTYLALAHGKMKEESGLISLPIERHSKNKHKFGIGTDLSRMAITEWKLLKQWKDYFLVEMYPHTGRTHQLRVHLKHFNHPIVSDPIYGGKSYKEDVKWCSRLFLHAKKLIISHPITGEKMEFVDELPQELNEVLLKLVD